MNLRIDLIRLDGGTQTRAELSFREINDYAEAMRGGAVFPPIVVFYDGKFYWLADGFHRVQAAISAEKKEIDTDVRQGTKDDAVWFSCGANATNGLRRTNEDKKRAVTTALAHPKAKGETDRFVGSHCCVDHKTVTKVRAECWGNPQHSNVEDECVDAPASPEAMPEKRTGKDGRSYNAKKPKPTEPEDDDLSETEDADEELVEADDRPIPTESVRAKGWGSFETSHAISGLALALRQAGDDVDRRFREVDPRFLTDVRERVQDHVITLMQRLDALLPPDGKRAQINRSKFEVLTGGK